jgi:hypothetical protein
MLLRPIGVIASDASLKLRLLEGYARKNADASSCDSVCDSCSIYGCCNKNFDSIIAAKGEGSRFLCTEIVRSQVPLTSRQIERGVDYMEGVLTKRDLT